MLWSTAKSDLFTSEIWLQSSMRPISQQTLKKCQVDKQENKHLGVASVEWACIPLIYKVEAIGNSHLED